MNRRHFHSLPAQALIGLCLALLLIGPFPTRANEPAPKGTLSGRVVGPDGKPVANAHVWIDTHGGKRLAETRTDAAGRFRLGPVPAVYRNPFPLLIEAEGLARQDINRDGISIFPGADNDLGTIGLVHGRRFTGQVLDADGKPKSNIAVECEVYYHHLGHTIGALGPSWKLTTDADGKFRTPPLPVGQLRVTVHAPGRQIGSASGKIAPGGEETLETIRLQEDVPLSGFVGDDEDRPVAGVEISTMNSKTTSDSQGKFVLRGFGPNPTFQIRVFKEGYAAGNFAVVASKDGFQVLDARAEIKRWQTMKDLSIWLQRIAWMEGRAVDADTGKPVRVENAVLCDFERKSDGEIVRRSSRSAGFEQPETGRFRIAYTYPDEYQLTLSADGYEDAESFTPKVTELKPIEGLVAKLKKKAAGARSTVPRQRISGAVTRSGRPVKNGWVGLWAAPRKVDVVNAYILRGRTVTGEPVVYARAPIRDGKYSLDVPFQDKEWYVVAEAPGKPLTQIGPIAVGVNEEKTLNIACTAGVSIAGWVQHVPQSWKGQLWVVAFTKTGIRCETRVREDGSFLFASLPPGEFGLKIGHDAYDDPDVPRDLRHVTKESREKLADPWKGAKIVNVKPDRGASGIELELPGTE